MPRRTPILAATLSSLVLAGMLNACSRRAVRPWNAADHDEESAGTGAAGQVPASANPNDPRALVEATWQSSCALCHGPVGHGDGPNGPMNKATNLTEPALLDARTDEQLATVIRQGRGKMPAFASLPPAVVSGLVGRIRALRGR